MRPVPAGRSRTALAMLRVVLELEAFDGCVAPRSGPPTAPARIDLRRRRPAHPTEVYTLLESGDDPAGWPMIGCAHWLVVFAGSPELARVCESIESDPIHWSRFGLGVLAGPQLLRLRAPVASPTL